MLFSNIFHFNLSFEDSSMKIETLRMFEKKSRDVKVLEKEGNRGVISSTRKRERERRCSVKNVRRGERVKVLLTRWKNRYRFWGNKLLIYTATLSPPYPSSRR